MKIEEADVVIVGSGPTGSAYARIIRRDWPDARILMVEAGPRTSQVPGLHLANLDEAERTRAEIAAQGPERAARTPITEAEWRARVSGGHDDSLLRRPGLFIANTDARDAGIFAGFTAAAVGGMGTQWTAGCPTPSRSELVDFIADAEMDAALDLAGELLGADPDPFPEDGSAAVLRERLSAVFDAGRPEDRRVQPMPLAIRREGDAVHVHGTDVVLGDLTSEPEETFRLLAGTACRRILHEGGSATGVELVDIDSGEGWTVRAGSVVVAANSLYGPQLLHASGIRPAALGRGINDHYQVVRMIQTDVPGPLRSMTWIPRIDEDWPFSVTIGSAGPQQRPFPVEMTGEPLFVGIFVAADVSEDSRLVFDDTATDWKGMPALSIDAAPTPADRERIAKGHALMDRLTETIGTPIPGIGAATLPVGSSLHYQGTMRMGAEDDGTSVCDPESRVWGFDNLHVAGNGIIPTFTATNPTLYCVALATIGARSIAARRRGAG